MMSTIVAVCLAALCGAIIYSDLRFMRIPNWMPIAALALFAVHVTLSDPGLLVLSQLAFTLAVFVVCFALFAARMMGGGDAKVIPALSLFVPIDYGPQIMVIFSACLLATIAITLVWRFAKGHSAKGKLPMGGAIGLTGLIALSATLW